MKRCLAFLILLIGSISAIACDTTTDTTTESTTDTTTLSTTTAITSATLNPDSLLANIPAECDGVAITNDWIPVWCEEFSYVGAVNSAKWRHQTGGGGYGNNELQNYTSRPQNAYVADGKLTITAIKENYGGNQYTSAKIWTQGVKNWKYGKFEMRAKMPSVGGTWPAFWMMPKSSVYGTWPNSGEIDIVEYIGNNLNNAVGTIHTGKYNFKIGTQIGFNRNFVGLSQEFHTYSVTWNETSFNWYVDDYKYGTTSFNPNANTDVDPYMAWPFDQEFYLILNLAIGGGMGGTVDPDFVSDTLEVDYVRVFQRDYVTGDTQAPTPIRSLQAVKTVGTTAYLLWSKPLTENMMIRFYNVYINGSFYRSVSLNTLKLTALVPGNDYLVEVEAEDYAGNLSEKVSITFTQPAS